MPDRNLTIGYPVDFASLWLPPLNEFGICSSKKIHEFTTKMCERYSDELWMRKKEDGRGRKIFQELYRRKRKEKRGMTHTSWSGQHSPTVLAPPLPPPPPPCPTPINIIVFGGKEEGGRNIHRVWGEVLQ
jgi:hypothetical protein